VNLSSSDCYLCLTALQLVLKTLGISGGVEVLLVLESSLVRPARGTGIRMSAVQFVRFLNELVPFEPLKHSTVARNLNLLRVSRETTTDAVSSILASRGG